MFDSNAIDPILDEPHLHHLELLNDLSARGLMEIVTTHVQADELAATLRTKPERGKSLLDVYTRLTKTVVPTTAAIWDKSNWDESSWGAGVGTLRIEDIMKTNPNDAEDALIAVTADTHADIFVCNEKDLPNRIKGKGMALEVLPFGVFIERMKKLS